MEKCQFKIKTCHVYGHQDKLTRHLTITEKLSCQMDSLAKEIATKYIAQEHKNTSFHSTNLGYGSITYNNTLVTSKVQSTLYTHILHNEMCAFLSSKLNITMDNLLHNIHWPSFTTARKESPLSLQIFISKWLSGDTATGRVMAQRKQRQHSHCPRCQATNEHLLHILTCPAPSTKDLHSNLVGELQEFLMKLKLTQILLHSLP